MKTKLKKFGAWLMAAALAFAGAGAYGAITTQAELNDAVAAAKAGDVVEITEAGTYKFPNLPNNITLKATVEGVVFDCKGSGSIASVPNGAKLEGLSFVFGNNNYHGWQHAGLMEFTNCSFNGLFFSYGDLRFEKCAFVQTTGEYLMWLYANKTDFVDCTFTAQGKFFNIYNEGNATHGPWPISFDGCTFSSSKSNKAALNVKATCGATPMLYDVTVNNCKIAEGGDNFPTASVSDTLIVFNGLIQLDDIKANVPNKITITQDGKVLYADNAVAEPEVVIAEPTKEAVLEKTVAADDVTPAQKAEKADEVVAVIAEAAEKETLEVSKSGLSEAGKTADGKLADPLVEALKTAAGEEKKDEITNETKVKKTIDVVFKGMTVEVGEKVTTTKIAYDVTPKALATLADGTPVKAAIPNDTFEKINFRMPLTADFAGRWLKVSRTDDGTTFENVGLYQAQKDGDVDFVQVDGDHFTTYVNEISDVTPVASINGKGYTSLADALKAVQPGETIKLVAEAEWNDANQIRATGFTLTSDGERKKIIVKKTMLFGGDNIKLDNIEFAADFYDEISMVSCNTGRKTSFEVSNCKFTGFYYSTGFQPIGCAKITDCEFKGGFRAIGMAYSYGDGVYFENCKISGVTYGIHFDGGDAPVCVKNCEIAAWSSYGGISSMSFEGCKFKSAWYNCVPAYVDTTFVNCEFDSDFECYAQATGFHWTFSGCKFGGAEFTESVLKENFEDSDVWEKCLLTIDGDKVRHTTESAAVKYVADPTDWLAEGYCAKQGADGKWTVAESVAEIVGGKQFATLQAAFDAAGANETVQLLVDITSGVNETYTVAAGKSITLDLNGKVLSGRYDKTTGFAYLTNNGTLTLKDGSVEGTGKITSKTDPETGNLSGFYTVFNKGTFVMESGTIEENSETVGGGNNLKWAFRNEASQNQTVSATIKGGTIVANYNAISDYVYDDSSECTLNVEGGVIKSTGRFSVVTLQNASASKPKFHINISGGEFIVENGINTNPNGNAIFYCDDQSGKSADFTGCFEITGGKFNTYKTELMVDYDADAGTPIHDTKFMTAGLSKCVIPQESIAEGYVCAANEDAETTAEGYLWKVVPQQLTPTVDDDAEKPTYDPSFPEEKIEAEETKEAIKEQTDNVKETLTSPVITQFTETNVEKPLFETSGALKADVKTALCGAVENMQGLDSVEKAAVKDAINGSGDSNSFGRVQIDLKEMAVGVAMVSDEVKATLNKASYDVKPILVTEVTITTDTETKTKTVKTEITKELLAGSKVRFRLAVGKEFDGQARVIHYSDAQKEHKVEDYYTAVLGKDDSKYVEIESDEFSPFDVLNANAVQLVCKVGEKYFESVTDAATNSADNAVIVLVNDHSEQNIKLKVTQMIDTAGYTFSGTVDESVLPTGYDPNIVTDSQGQAFMAPAKVKVPIGESSVIKVRMLDTAESLAAPQANGRPLWANKALGIANDFVIKPQVERPEVGSKTISIKSNISDEVLEDAAKQRDGVSVKFQLAKKVGSAGTYVQFGDKKLKPEFTVEADDQLEVQTFWKIQIFFEEEY